MADDAGDAEIFIVDQRAGKLLVGREIGANEARHVIDGAADLPALDDLVDGGEPLLEPAAIACRSRMISAKTLTGRDSRPSSTTA